MKRQDRPSGLLRRMAASLTQTKAEQRAEELQVSARVMGATPIAGATIGDPATIAGVLQSVTLRPQETVPAVEAELFDGSGRILVIWLGRRRIRGIDPGRSIVVHGRITGTRDRRTMFNPRYELRPQGRGES